jgi:hypothetical protein
MNKLFALFCLLSILLFSNIHFNNAGLLFRNNYQNTDKKYGIDYCNKRRYKSSYNTGYRKIGLLD